jgi:hypothetical protein
MDTALALQILLPEPKYSGVVGTTEAEYDAITWHDIRPKPTWVAVQAVDLSAYLEQSQALDAIQSLGIVSLLKLLDEVIRIQMQIRDAARLAGMTIDDYTPEAVALWTEFHARLGELE